MTARGGWSGRRVVVGGAETRIGVAMTRQLVELGAEVHAVAAASTSPTDGVASFTSSLDSTPAAIAKRIGAVVDAVLVVLNGDAEDASAIAAACEPNMLSGGAVVLVGTDDRVAALASAAPASSRSAEDRPRPVRRLGVLLDEPVTVASADAAVAVVLSIGAPDSDRASGSVTRVAATGPLG